MISENGYLSFLTYLLAFLFVIMHEYGHSLSAKYIFDRKVESIVIYPIGGLATINSNLSCKREELIVTLCGPLVNLAIAVLFFPILFVQNENVVHFAFIVFFINLVLFCFNILPIYPMDGGRILRALLQYFGFSFSKSTVITIRTSQVMSVICSLIFIFVFQNFLSVVVMMFMFYLATLELQKFKIKTPHDDLLDLEEIKFIINAVAEKSGNFCVTSNWLSLLYESHLIKDVDFRQKYKLDSIEKIIINDIKLKNGIEPSLENYEIQKEGDNIKIDFSMPIKLKLPKIKSIVYNGLR